MTTIAPAGPPVPGGLPAAMAAAAACALTALVVLAGWLTGYMHLTTFWRNWTPMVASTALAVFACAMAIVALVRARDRGGRLAPMLGLVAATIAAVTLADFASFWTRGVGLYPPVPWWRMAPSTAVVLVCVGVALALWNARGGWERLPEPLLTLAVILATHTLLAFVLGATPKSDLLGSVNMSPITGLCLVTLGVTLLLLLPRGRVARVVMGTGTGSRAARPVALVVLVLPAALGWLRLRAEQLGFLTLEYAVALMILGTALVSTVAIIWFAERVNAYERTQRRELGARAILANVSDTLGRSVNLDATLSSIAELCVPALADWCVIALCRDDGMLHNVAVVHSDPERVRWAREFQERYPPDPHASTGAAAVARTGRMEYHAEIPESLLDAAVPDPEQRNVIRALGMRSALTLPMIASTGTVGVLTLVTAESERRLDEDDVHVAQQVAERCAVAIERARLFENLERELGLRREAEASLRALAAELEERVAHRTAELAVTNRELESFAYSVSHDLRTPLRGLDGFSQALLDDYADRLDDTGKDYLSRIRRGSQRMGDLIDSLLELSRVSRGDLERQPVDLSAIAEEQLAALKNSAPERRVATTVQPGLTVQGDPRLLRALLQNLLGNAWKFTAKRAEAKIEFAVEAGNGRHGTGPVFVVRDNGAGFDMTYASRLFGAFQRLHTNREFEGTGVGLATVQRIVHRHGGEIWAQAAPDEGAAFYFTLG